MTLTPQRHLFEIPEDVAYLNCAYMAPNLRSVRAAGERAVAGKSRPWEVAPEDFFADSEAVRRRFAEIVGGDAEGVAIVPSVSYGIGTAAANLVVGEGDEIVVLAEQFPSNVYPWRDVAARARASIRTVPRGVPWTTNVIEAMGKRTAVVAVPNVHWTDGTLVDLEQVGAAARAVGAALVVDATQSLGALPFDAERIRPDFVVAAAYKWLLGPYSLAFLWAAPDRRDGRPLEQGWIVRAGSDDFAGLVDYRDEYAPGARRYDVGERSNFVLLPMALAALDQVLDWTVPAIAATIARHTGRIERGTAELGLVPVPEASRGPHLLGIEVPGGLPHGLARNLADAGVHVSIRGASIRVSPHVWTTEEDLDRLLDTLERSV